MNKKLWVTVTPLSKAMAMTLFVLLPFGGFYLGLKTRIPEVKPVIINKTVVAEPTTTIGPTPTENVPEKGEVFIKDGDAYYIEPDGTRKIIARHLDSEENPVKSFHYNGAVLSPSKRFVLLGVGGWEGFWSEVYDFKTSKLYQVNGTGNTYWLSDNRLLTLGCNDGMGCFDSGIYLSINGVTPWKMNNIGEIAP